METETTIAKSIRITEAKSRYDEACKELLSEKIILAWIIKSCIAEFAEPDVKEIAERYIEGEPEVSVVPVAPDEEKPTKIKGEETEDKKVNEKTIRYDIRFRAIIPGTEERMEMLLNVEAQENFYPGYPLVKRGVYYGSRMVSAQYGKEFAEGYYGAIKKVASIWVCMSPPKYRQNTIARYRIIEENIVGKTKEPPENYDLINVVMICLGAEDGDNYGGVLRLLEVLLSNERKKEEKETILEDEFHIPMSQTLERKVGLMCNLSEGVWNRGMQQGMQQGIQQGMQQGMQQGVTESQTVFNLILSGIRDMATLVAKSGYSRERVDEIVSGLNIELT